MATKKRNTSKRKTKKAMKKAYKSALARVGIPFIKAKKKSNPKKRNPLPIGKLVTVKAVRRADGKIDLYR